MTDDPDASRSPWGQTLAEANAMADSLREDGWEVVTVRAGHVSAVPPGHDGADHDGLVYLAPDDVAESLPAVLESADLGAYDVFRNRVGDDLFLLTRLTDPDARVAVLLVGSVTRSSADDLREAAREEGVLRSHVRLLDGTHLASFEHDDPGAFFPSLE